MRKMTDDEFKALLEARVALAAGSIKKITQLADRRPDLMPDVRIDTVVNYMTNQIEALQLDLDAVRARRTSSEGFSLDSPVEAQEAPSRAPRTRTTGRLPPASQRPMKIADPGYAAGSRTPPAQPDDADFITE